eukprot:TRINITY_DN33780_c0_g1_i1.p1 TRINITY_DN33780_c0_g1~~TRINITY_DN33780_c0_g1_i1.p1  ORF type:complete len:351 (-),score=36.97 TRINITY_DN33780_c0_g1_i1:39-1091(-)
MLLSYVLAGWSLFLSLESSGARRIGVNKIRIVYSLKKVVVFDLDETLSRVSVMQDFPSESHVNSRLNLPEFLMQMVDDDSTYDTMLNYTNSTSMRNFHSLMSHVWYEFAGAYDGPRLRSTDANKPHVTIGEGDSPYMLPFLPTRVSKLRSFLQELAEQKNIAVVVLSNTRLGPDIVVAKLKFLGLDQFVDGVFAARSEGQRLKMRYMRNQGDGSWARASVGNYDDDKTRILKKFIARPGDYLSSNKYGTLRTSWKWGQGGVQLEPKDVVLIDNSAKACFDAEEEGFLSFHVKKTVPFEPASQRSPAGFGVDAETAELDFGCHTGSPKDLLLLCPGAADSAENNYWFTRGI